MRFFQPLDRLLRIKVDAQDRTEAEARQDPLPVPVIDYGDVRIEDSLSATTVFARGGINNPALAANFSMIQLINPATSDVDVVVSRIVGSVNAAGVELRVIIGQTALATIANTGNLRDLRRASSVAAALLGPRAQLRTEQAAAIPGAANITGWVMLTQGVPHSFIEGDENELLLAPSWGVMLVPNAVNLYVAADFSWREIPRRRR